jgi:6-phosphogluconolactonase
MPTVAYVANADSGDISVAHLDARTGAWAPVQTFATGGKVMPLAISADRRFLYASLRDAPARVLSCAIEPGSGRLRRLQDAALPESACHIALDRTGRWLFSAAYGAHRIGVNPIDADGFAQAPHQVIETPPNAHTLCTDPSNRFAFSPCLGGNVVLQMRFDAKTGRLHPNPTPALHLNAGAGPRHLAFHPGGRIVYLLSELDATLCTLALDPVSGCLRVLHSVGFFPAGTTGKPWGAELRLTPDARHLVASERRSSTLSLFNVDPASGELQLVDQMRTEVQPRGLAIDPTGRWVVAAGQESHRVGVHALDAAAGRLGPGRAFDVGRNPNWVELINLG